MPGTTPRLALPYATPDDTTDPPRDIRALAEKLDTAISIPEAGDMRFSARKNEHGNWIKADGRALAAGQYTPLRDALIADGSPYGADAGNPKLPDMRDRVPVGAGAGYAHGAYGGAATHTLTSSQMPAHTHSAYGDGDIAGVGGSAYRVLSPAGSGANQYKRATLAINIAAAGGNAAHNNMQPYTVGTWFIYAG